MNDYAVKDAQGHVLGVVNATSTSEATYRWNFDSGHPGAFAVRAELIRQNQDMTGKMGGLYRDAAT